MNIHQSIDCWHHIFKVSIINKVAESDIKLKSSSISCPFAINDQLFEPKSIQLTFLMDHTTQLLQQLQTEHSHQISQIISYREILSFRRTVMIIYVYNSIDDDTRYHQLLYIIHSLILQHYKPTLRDKKYFNIHISKSGGTSICSTFNNLPFSIKLPESTVCNYHWNEKKSSICQETYDRTKQYDMVAKEVPLDVFYDEKSDDYHPKLCDDFIYLLPFRHPLEKSFSWANGDNVLYHHYRTQFYRLIPVQNKTENDNDLPCLEQSIIIDGYIYKRITKGHHYRNFFAALFDSENATQKPLSSWDEALAENVEYKLKSEQLNVSLPQCMYKDQQNQNWIYIFFNLEDKPGAPFMMKYRKTQWPFPGLRLPRSSAGNTWTSWLGYGDNNMWPSSAQLNPRFMIRDKHFVNACMLMLGIDYVLPFWRYLDFDHIDDGRMGITVQERNRRYSGMGDMGHKIWKITYQDIIEHFENLGLERNEGSEKGGDWIYHGHTSGRDDVVHAENVAKNMTENDIEVLRANNVYDLTLFRLAQWIALVDVEFIELFDG